MEENVFIFTKSTNPNNGTREIFFKKKKSKRSCQIVCYCNFSTLLNSFSIFPIHLLIFITDSYYEQYNV